MVYSDPSINICLLLALYIFSLNKQNPNLVVNVPCNAPVFYSKELEEKKNKIKQPQKTKGKKKREVSEKF